VTDFVYATKDHLWRVRTSQKKTDNGDCIRYILVGDKWLPHSQISEFDARQIRFDHGGGCPDDQKSRHEHGLPFLT
jgi:hypothetical protein